MQYVDSSGPLLTVSWRNCPQLGIWTKPGAPFVCIEPWHGFADLAGTARDLLRKPGMAHVAPGGRLVYAVCTLTRSETTAVADAFTAAHPDFIPDPVLGGAPQLTLWPDQINANGMFIAAWRRTAS